MERHYQIPTRVGNNNGVQEFDWHKNWIIPRGVVSIGEGNTLPDTERTFLFHCLVCTFAVLRKLQSSLLSLCTQIFLLLEYPNDSTRVEIYCAECHVNTQEVMMLDPKNLLENNSQQAGIIGGKERVGTQLHQAWIC